MKYIHPKLIIKGFNAERIKTEDINPSSVGTYEEWVESGEPIDPCDDAIWLHDDE